MSAPIYGSIEAPPCEPILTTGIEKLENLDEFIQDLGRIMHQLKAERDKEKGIARLENLRRAMLVVLGKENEHYVIPPPADTPSSNATKSGSKLVLKSQLAPKKTPG